jgi:DNA invertase Pin-like site-specific DNA recombinase
LIACSKNATAGKFEILASVDRLGRSLQDLIGLSSELHSTGRDLYVHQRALDTSTPSGRAMFQMFGVFAESERGMIRFARRAEWPASHARRCRPPRCTGFRDHSRRRRGSASREDSRRPRAQIKNLSSNSERCCPPLDNQIARAIPEVGTTFRLANSSGSSPSSRCCSGSSRKTADIDNRRG